MPPRASSTRGPFVHLTPHLLAAEPGELSPPGNGEHLRLKQANYIYWPPAEKAPLLFVVGLVSPPALALCVYAKSTHSALMLPPRRTNLPKSSMLAGNGSSAENRIGPPLRRSQLDWKPLNRQIPALTGRREVFKSPSCCSCSSRRVLNTLTDTHIPSCPQQSTSSQPTPPAYKPQHAGTSDI